jgi:hypothetical protein
VYLVKAMPIASRVFAKKSLIQAFVHFVVCLTLNALHPHHASKIVAKKAAKTTMSALPALFAHKINADLAVEKMTVAVLGAFAMI